MRRGVALLSQARLLVSADVHAVELAYLAGVPIAVLERADARANGAAHLYDAWLAATNAEALLLRNVPSFLCC